ncbi:hypothetical protein GIB67_002575 [Kingdonia uniflora]|uniref:Tubby C-terminal domain-containing protein n=1 Tax=Kingdonia uniflora TaxID=39325 RepID=A0A7J7N3Z0_9MAGN|nr:hypothetical protein GIB67_002575 [Kingdonia uniflora]
MSTIGSFLSRNRSQELKTLNHNNSSEEQEIDHHQQQHNVDRFDDSIEETSLEEETSSWATVLPELLADIIQRVESSELYWPLRKDIVSCACVCKRWRHVTKGVVRSSGRSGRITFPSSLKQSGPRFNPLKCFIKRNKKNSTFYLYLGLTQQGFITASMDKGKFLLAARRVRHGAHTDYILSYDADDLSQGSNAYIGKLRSNFLGTKFTIYDSQPPHSNAKPSSSRSSRRFASKQISPQVPSANFEIGHVSYKFNLFKSRGPRRLLCTLKVPAKEEPQGVEADDDKNKCMVLRNKVPRWHEHLQCWCLNFNGRVTVASVKNFQLVAGNDETVLQFGKIGEDVFTMDYMQPLSAFQAFAICLTSFGTKLACE